MTTKFDVGEEVYLKATVVGIDILQQSIKYRLAVKDVASTLLLVMEENIVKKGDNDERTSQSS